jgi:hypothetical protein
MDASQVESRINDYISNKGHLWEGPGRLLPLQGV